MIDALRTLTAGPATLDLSLGGLPLRFGGVDWSFCTPVDADSIRGALTCAVASDFELRRIVAGLIVPSDIRFLDGLEIDFRSSGVSSAAIDEQRDVIPVLVAESDDPSRCQFPLISIFHSPPPEVALPMLLSKISLTDEDWLESSSSRPALHRAVISRARRSAVSIGCCTVISSPSAIASFV